MTMTTYLILSVLLQVGLDTAAKLMNGLDKAKYDKLNSQLNKINSLMTKSGLDATEAAQKLGYYSDIMSRFPNISKVYTDAKEKSEGLKAKYDKQLHDQKNLIDNAKDLSNEANKLNPNQTVGERIGGLIQNVVTKGSEWLKDATTPKNERK